MPLGKFRLQPFYEASWRLEDFGFRFQYVVEDSFDLRLIFEFEH